MNSVVEAVERQLTERGEIQLQKRNNHYEIIYNGTFLMATYNGESERLLVKAALHLCDNPQTVLIGGLGVGFSLAEALSDSRIREVDVIEIEKVIIEWNRKYLGDFSSFALEDTRTNIINADLISWISGSNNKYDALCLDIDNGPDWTVSDTNGDLYADHGMNKLLRLLNPGGVISFWSATKSDAFLAKLRSMFSIVEVKLIPQERGEPDYVYLGKAPNI